MTIASLGVALFASARRNARLHTTNLAVERDNRQLRNELGFFAIEDPKKTHILRLPGNEGVLSAGVDPSYHVEPLHSYRFFLPKGRLYKLCLRVDGSGLPAESLPEPGLTYDLEPGEYLFSFRLGQDEKSSGIQRLSFNVEPQGEQKNSQYQNRIVYDLPSEVRRLLDSPNHGVGTTIEEVGRELECFDAVDPIVIYRKALEHGYDTRLPFSDREAAKVVLGPPWPGVMIWIVSEEIGP